MARIQCRVARGHNRRRRVLGRLWQSRYKARVVRDDAYFRQLLAYVHLNPVAAGAVDYRGEPVGFSSTLRVGLSRAVTLVCSATGFTVDDLRSRSRSPDIAMARRAFAILAVHRLNHSVAEVALMLQRHPGSVSRRLETSRCMNDSTCSVSEILEFAPDLDVDPIRM